MTPCATVPADQHDSTDHTDNTDGTSVDRVRSDDTGSAAPTVVPPTGSCGDARATAPRGQRAEVLAEVLLVIVAVIAVLGLGLLMPGPLTSLALLTGLAAAAGLALVVTSPWLLFTIVAMIGLVVAVKRSRRSTPGLSRR